jgi:Rrf2 family protein
MLSISNKSRYGLKALLVLAENYGLGLLSTKEIAAGHDMPRQYLEQIFNQLGKATIIQSVRGKQGGYKLARPPGEILASEIITLLEGGVEFVSDATDFTDVVQALLRSAEEKLLGAFDVSLAELLSRQAEQRKVIMYNI